jgi:hypothetical protein
MLKYLQILAAGLFVDSMFPVARYDFFYYRGKNGCILLDKNGPF